MAVLQDISSESSLLAEINRLREENAALVKASKGSQGWLKVTEKGGLSVYGLGRFPVTLYRGQWEKLFAKVEDIKQFILDNSAALSVKE